MWSDSDAVIQHVKNAFDSTEAGTSTLDNDVLSMRGNTGRKTRIFYNNLGNINEATVLIDVGTKNGSSTVSFLKNNENLSVCVIDDWSHGGSTEELQNTVKSSKLRNVVSKPDTVDISLLPKANILLYDTFYFDGELVRSIQKLSNVFADVCVLIVDDWNALGVVNQTYTALSSIDYSVVYERSVKTNYDSEAADTYWNGIGVFVLKKNGVAVNVPVVVETAPVVAEAVPVVVEAVPVVAEVAPVVAEVAPVVAEVAPVVAEVAPVVAEVAPVVAEVAPVVAEVAPVVAEVAPVVAEVAPVVAEVAPVVAEVAPVVAEAAPVVETPA